MVVRRERTLRDCLQVSVNTGVIVHGYQWQYVTSGFMDFLPLFIPVFFSGEIQQCSEHSRRAAGSYDSIKAFLQHLGSRYYLDMNIKNKLSLWLLVMSIAHLIFFKVGYERAPCSQNNAYLWLCFVLSHIKGSMIIFLLKALVQQRNSSVLLWIIRH